MRHYDTSCGPMSCVPTRKDGVPEFDIKLLLLSCSGVAIPLAHTYYIIIVHMCLIGNGMLIRRVYVWYRYLVVSLVLECT